MQSRVDRSTQHDLEPMRQFFSRVPEAHLLFVVPPACCRCRWFEGEFTRTPGQVSFLYIDDTDIAMGEFAAQIADSLRTILPYLNPRPPAVEICFTCAFEIVGVDYDMLVEELELEFADIVFLTFPIHHLSTTGAVGGPENRELSLYKALRKPLPRRADTVNIVDATVSFDNESELYLALQACGVKVINQAVFMKTFEEFCSLACAGLNILIGRMGKPACEYMQDKLGIPWLSLPETYSVSCFLEGIGRLCSYYNVAPPDFSSRAARVLEKARRAAAAFEGHPLVVSNSSSADTIDLAAALMDYGFEVAGIDTVFAREANSPLLDVIRKKNPDVAVFAAHLHEAPEFPLETVVLSSYLLDIEGPVYYCELTSHADPMGLSRIDHMLDELLAYARKWF